MVDPYEYEKEVRRLAELIGSLVELSGRPVEEVAERAGLSPEDLAGIFRGVVNSPRDCCLLYTSLVVGRGTALEGRALISLGFQPTLLYVSLLPARRAI